MAARNQEIKAALSRYSKEELIDLMEHLLGIYVLDEPVKLDASMIRKPENIRELAGYSFPQLISYLQNNLEMEELGRFRITPYTVYVSIGEVEFDLNGPTPVLAPEGGSAEDDDEMSPAQRADVGITDKPWRYTPSPKPQRPQTPAAETPSMAELFKDDKGRGFAMFDEPPSRAEDGLAQDIEDEAPPIADFAPGDDPTVKNEAPINDFAAAAAAREDSPSATTPPPLAEGDKQIDPSNRFASLDLD